MADDDWDLYAVVRSCKAVTTAGASTTSTTPTPVHHDGFAEPSWMWDLLKHEEVVETHNPLLAGFPNLESSASTNAFHGLEEFYQPFFPSPILDTSHKTTISTATATSNYAPAGTIIPNSPTSFISDFGGGSTSGQRQQQQNNFLPANTNSPHFNPGFTPVRFPEQQLLKQPKLEKAEHPEEVLPMLKPVGLVGPSMATIQIPPHLIRPRKRKCPVKKMVCQLTAENLNSSDLWAWRKYGQKPIKGSPHPRNYYRCSSSKGCSARKQVERSNEDPDMFVVTYCGDHTHPRPTHRNSLAGSTRNKSAFTTSNPPVQLLPCPAAQGGDDHDGEVQAVANNNSGDGDKAASEEAEDEEIEEDEDDEEFAVSDEDIFLGMKQLGRTGSGGSTLGSLGAGANSDDGFPTKQSNMGSSWGAGCSSSAGATVRGGC